MSVGGDEPGPAPDLSARWRPSPLLPSGEVREVSLHFVVGVLCFLACLALIAGISADRAARGWARDLHAQATIQVRPRLGETGSEAAARAAEALAGVRGVSEAAALERDKAEALLQPWLGKAVLKDLPIPELVTVRLDPRHPASASDLSRALIAAGVDAEVDDHGPWLKDVERAAGIVRWIVLSLFALTAAAAAAAVAFATRAGLAAHRDVVEVLHLSGAHDAYVAGLFQLRFGRLAMVSGFWAAAAAAGATALIKLAGGGQGFTPALPLAWSDLLLVSPCPLVAATVGALAARWTTLRLLKGTV